MDGSEGVGVRADPPAAAVLLPSPLFIQCASLHTSFAAFAHTTTMKLSLPNETRDDGFVTLWLKQPERSVVVLDQWLLDQLHLFFDQLEQSPPRGLAILSASPNVFVAGADLAVIDALNDDSLLAYLAEGAEAFGRISALPCPTVAAINGAALGGGLELALHCDGIIASAAPLDSKPYRIGLPEASLGLCPGWGGTQMLPARIDPAEAIVMTASGETRTLLEFPPGLIDRVVDNEDDLHEAALHWLEAQHEYPGATPKCIDETNRQAVKAALDAVQSMLPRTPAAQAVVEAVRIGMEEGLAAGLAAERRLLVGLRHTEEAKKSMAKFFARSKAS
jgi:enoyl-CoA hydratase/carnithine racemase